MTSLFGVKDAEVLYSDLATAYEVWADDQADPPAPDSTVVIEEWSVADLKLIAGADLAEWVHERTCDDVDGADEGLHDSLERAADDPDVIAAFQVALDLMVSKVGWRQADDRLAEHVVTHDEDGEPWLNGSRLYQKG